MHWQPTASNSMLKARAALNQKIRQFFATRGVLEVETPLMCQAIGTDPNLSPITALYQAHATDTAVTHYLQTSPEFAMKRLLAAGSGPIFQLCKAFRNGETGTRHNPEFTMLEWYRPGFSLQALMDEVEELVREALSDTVAVAKAPFRRLSYRELFQQRLGFDPHTVSQAMLQRSVLDHIDMDSRLLTTRPVCLDLLYGHVIEPMLLEPVFIHGYPAEQAALARMEVDEESQAVALRFELVVGGMELANGYDELIDATEQQKRFASDRVLRQQQGLPDIDPDMRFLAALQHGVPPCAGVALGVDRLLMLQTGARTIDEVLAFPVSRA